MLSSLYALSHKTIQQRFLVSLFSSWLVNPLWVTLAHVLGYSSDSHLKILLLGIGAGMPFQLMLNECLAVRAVQSSISNQLILAAPVLIIQLPAVYWALSGSGLTAGHENFSILVATALAFAHGVSYFVAVRTYQVSLEGLVSLKGAIMIGAAPGFVYLLAYVAYFTCRYVSPIFPVELLALIAFLPALVQCWMVFRCYGVSVLNNKQKLIFSIKSIGVITSFAVLFSGLTHLATKFRLSAADYYPSIAAILLVILGMLGTIVNTVLRGDALVRRRRHSFRWILGGVLICGFLSIFSSGAFWVNVSSVLALQLMMLAMLDYGRRYLIS